MQESDFTPNRLSLNPGIPVVGARKGARGSLDELKARPPLPKSWLRPSLASRVVERLKANQQAHSRLDLGAIIQTHLFDQSQNRYRLVWSKNMIPAAGLSAIKRKGADPELVLHLRDGEEERSGDEPWMRQVIESQYQQEGASRGAVEDLVYLVLVHEASEIHAREQAETLVPDIKAEIRAEIEEAKAYFSLPPDRRKALKQLYKSLDETNPTRGKSFSEELELFENIGEPNLGTIEGLLALIEFIVGMPDYARESKLYAEVGARLQLARSLFVDILHDFAGASSADNWVRAVESSAVFASTGVKFVYTKNSQSLSKQAEELLQTAARILETLRVESTDPEALPGKNQIKHAIRDFNKKIEQLDPIKSQLELNEVLS
ncbi:MAG: hypothetical protein RL120_03245, partial [Gammaproteobacteria bacterium]